MEGIEPDTLFVELAPIADKIVHVKADIQTDFEPQFMQSGEITLEPQEITISGPKSVIDTIKIVRTKQIKFKKLNQKVTKKLSLIPVNQVSFSDRTVILSLPVEKYTEITVKVPVEIENQPDNVRLMFIPRTIDVKCNVVLSKFFTLKPVMFKAVVDYGLISNSLNKKLKVKLKMVPEFINLIDYYPKYVEYIIESR